MTDDTLFDWPDLMNQWNDLLLDSKNMQHRISEETRKTRWLGYKATTDSEILALETRLRVELPLSYKEFLKFSNGWGLLSYSIFKVWDASQVDWFYVKNQQWIDAWSSDGKDREGLNYTLEISDRGDAAIFLLNPRVKSSSGEWESILFTNWAGQVIRKESFWDLMIHQFERFKYIDAKMDEKKRNV